MSSTIATSATPHHRCEPSTQQPLASLPRGARARITGISQDHGPQVAQRLADLGFEPGREVEVVRRAPLGDPTVYLIANYSVSLRRRDAALVVVEALEARP